jgi:hypothetical protein
MSSSSQRDGMCSKEPHMYPTPPDVHLQRILAHDRIERLRTVRPLIRRRRGRQEH